MRQEREALVVGGLVATAVLLWLGFLVHVSPRFPGSGWGLMLGASAAALMLVPLVYSVAKRVNLVHRWLTRRVSMRTWLAVHIYAGVLAPILALLHSSHRFVSPVGIFLTAMLLIVMLSGFVGRYLLRYASGEAAAKRSVLARLRSAYTDCAAELAATAPSGPTSDEVRARPLRWLLGKFFVESSVGALGHHPAARRAAALAEATADVEYAVRSQEWFKGMFRLWLKIHGALAALLYASLALHIWLELRLGLRWFS